MLGPITSLKLFSVGDASLLGKSRIRLITNVKEEPISKKRRKEKVFDI